MKLKILSQSVLIFVFLLTTHSKANIASQVEHFLQRPVLRNFINTLHRENRWKTWAFDTSVKAPPSNVTSLFVCDVAHQEHVQNFILPGFGRHLDSFFLHDTIGTERCEDAIRVETFNSDGITTHYLSVAYCLGTRDKTFTLGADRTSIVHIYEYANNILQSTYTTLCPVRTDFGCHLNYHGGQHKDTKELTLNHKVAQSLYFDEEEYSLDFIKEYTRQVAHIMIDTKQIPRAHYSTTDHANQEDTYLYYNIPFHMAQLATSQHGLSAKLYQRGVAALFEKRAASASRKSYLFERANDGYTTEEDSELAMASQKGRSTKECAGQIMRVCGFSTDFLVTSWNKRQIASMLDQYGIDISNGRCILDEQRHEFSLIKSLDEQFTGVIPYFFDNDYLSDAVYTRGLNHDVLTRSLKRAREGHTEPTLHVTISHAKRRTVAYAESHERNDIKKSKMSAA